MKIKLIIFSLLTFINITANSQVIFGEKNPCPEVDYHYSISGISNPTGSYYWFVEDGTIISQTNSSAVIRWNKNIINNGRWKVSVDYEVFTGPTNSNRQQYRFGESINVKATTAFTIGGDNEIRDGFRGIKTYTAIPKNPNFPATSYQWHIKTGTSVQSVITSSPTIDVNIVDDNFEWIAVEGKNSTCSTWGYATQLIITRIIDINGPSFVCSDATYSITGSPNSVTLENSNGIATLTSLGNNQWKVTRIGSANGTVSLKARNSSNFSISKVIDIGSPSPLVIGNNITSSGSHTYLLNNSEYFTDVTWSVYSTTNNVNITSSHPNRVVLNVSNWNNRGNNIIFLTLNAKNNCGENVSLTFTKGVGSSGGGYEDQ